MLQKGHDFIVFKAHQDCFMVKERVFSTDTNIQLTLLG